MSINRIKAVADKISRRVTAYMLMCLVLTVTYQVFARQFFRISTPWTEEMSKNFLIWATFTGAISLYVRGENLIVDVLSVHYPPTLRKAMRILVNLIVMVVAGSLTYFGYMICTNRMILNSVTISMGVSRVWMYFLMPISMAVVCVLAVLDMFQISSEDGRPGAADGKGGEGQC